MQARYSLWLLRLGIKCGDVVAVEGRSSAPLWAFTLSCINIGAIFVLVDTKIPAQRKAEMKGSAGVSSDIHIDYLDGHTTAWNVEGEFLGQIDCEWHQDAYLNLQNGLDIEVGCNEPCYIVFTSGTTGKPKPILGSRKGLLHFVKWQVTYFKLNVNDRVAQVTSLGFDVVLREIFSPLSAGAKVVIPPRDLGLTNGPEMFKWLKKETITVLHCVPSVAAKWMQQLASEENFSLRAVFFAGEKLSSSIVHAWRGQFKNCEIVNLYGPSETTLAKFFFIVPDNMAAGVQPVGKPIPDTDYVVTVGDFPKRVIVEKGQAGEVCIISQFSSYGYLDGDAFGYQPNLTDNSAPIYPTGDIGFTDTEGNLNILGRSDDQVKIDGVRIEPSEIAHVLSTHRNVIRVEVIPHKSEENKWMLSAFCVLADTDCKQITMSQLKEICFENLLTAMIPNEIKFVIDMPITANGKLDRKRLLDTRANLLLRASKKIHRELVELWSDILGTSVDSINTSFFQMGGDSLSAVHLALAISERFGVELGVSHIYAAQTIEELSVTLEKKSFKKTPAPINFYHTGLRVPLSLRQESYRLIQLMTKKPNWTTMIGGFEIPVGSEKFVRWVIGVVVQRHDILSSRWEERKGNYYQVYQKNPKVSLTEHSITASCQNEVQEQLKSFDQVDLANPMSTDEDVLLKFELVRCGQQRSILRWKIHHAISDGQSQDILTTELKSLLNSKINSQPVSLREISSNYRGFSQWQHSADFAKKTSEQGLYWKKKFTVPHIHSKIGMRPDALHIGAGNYYARSYTYDLQRWTACAKSSRVSLFSLILSAFFVVIRKLYSSDDVVLRTVTSGRTLQDFTPLNGLFFCPVYLRQELSSVSSWNELMSNTQNEIIEVTTNQDYPIHMLLKDLNIEITNSVYPLTNIMINYHNFGNQKSSNSNLLRAIDGHGTLGMDLRVDLTLLLKHFGDSMTLQLDYRAELFTETQIEEVMAALEICLDSLCMDPGCDFSSILPQFCPELMSRIKVL